MSDMSSEVILAIGAHPDDVEFGCGATMAYFACQGANLHFAIATDGNRGSRQHQFDKAELVATRKQELQAAATILGAKEVIAMEEEDGNLMADVAFKEKVVRIIRKVRPTKIFTHDPSWFYAIGDDGGAIVNHTDHRACGEAVIDAVYPLARDLQSFPHHADEGLVPHTVPELYLFSHGTKGNFAFDILEADVQTQIDAIKAHISQIDDPEGMAARMRARHTEEGQRYGHTWGDAFTRLEFKR